MPAFHRRSARLGLTFMACAALAACGGFNNASTQLASVVTPYKIEVVQGNFVSKEQVAALSPGMSRNDVKNILGTPLLASVFHADRWDYVFTLRRQGVEPQSRRLTVFFKNDVLERFEGDDMPSEAEFVSKLDSRRKKGKVPELEASEESLKKFPAPAPAASTEAAAPLPPAPASYPPLEAPAR
ncbi:outer membrane protein assembly factor BamE [Variovorax terrae]|uniref:Outer membrane protein assembly factor BamE n=1 Tax=Variovorax terrae TaxID=2923278 RepID=A0A9X2AQ28_9BURK|nr:outer membrane protein assembly factor BamE [Variovorax terrae]MCJ0765934.1 outer membrane protein assembly factor BamE [Variovorax terrae]